MNVLEEYRKTLAALNELLKKKKQEGAPDKYLGLLYTEMDEVAEVIRHLEKGESRYRW